ncbi:hypothetical protein H0X48_06250 [Candidatus Dependentiae bacterium]|nr:hypothetical protein [Candidatus Dependentiae bacterium]
MQKILCLIVSFTITTIPLLGRSFVLRPKPAAIFLPKTGCALSTLIIAAEFLFFYKALSTSNEKHRDRKTDRIYYITKTPPQKTSLKSIYLNTCIMAGSIVFLQKSLMLFNWIQRTNQEVYDDAQGSYNHITKQATSLHYLVQHLLEASTLAQKQQIKTDYTQSYCNALTTLELYYTILDDHYNALVEREKKGISTFSQNEWYLLKKNMESELSKLVLSIDFLKFDNTL